MTASAATAPAWQRGRVASWLVTTDHKRIGILYVGTGLAFFCLAGLMALVFRLQLSQANGGVLGADRFHELLSVSDTLLVFFVIVPLFAGLGNHLVPPPRSVVHCRGARSAPGLVPSAAGRPRYRVAVTNLDQPGPLTLGA